MNYSNPLPLLIYSETWAPPRKTTPRVKAEMKEVPQTFFFCKGRWEPVQLGASILDSTLVGKRVQEISLPSHQEVIVFSFSPLSAQVSWSSCRLIRIRSRASINLYCSTKNEITVSPLIGELKRLFSEMSSMGHLGNKPSGTVSTDSIKQVIIVLHVLHHVMFWSIAELLCTHWTAALGREKML